MDELKSGLTWHKLTDEVEAVLFSSFDYSRDEAKVTLSKGTIFRVETDAGEVNGKRVNAIAANGKTYRVDSQLLVRRSAIHVE
jgi:hypothetical protein